MQLSGAQCAHRASLGKHRKAEAPALRQNEEEACIQRGFLSSGSFKDHCVSPRGWLIFLKSVYAHAVHPPVFMFLCDSVIIQTLRIPSATSTVRLRLGCSIWVSVGVTLESPSRVPLPTALFPPSFIPTLVLFHVLFFRKL